MSFDQITLIYPSCRPDSIIPCIELAKSKSEGEIDFIVGFNSSREKANEIAKHTTLAVWFGETLFRPAYTRAVNLTFRAAVKHAIPGPIFPYTDPDPADYIVGYWSDDFVPEQGWDVKIKKAFEDPKIQVVGAYDGIHPVDYAVTIPFFRLSWLYEQNGGLFWVPHYKYVIDVEPHFKSRDRGEFYFAQDCLISHRHYINRNDYRVKDNVDIHNSKMLRHSRDYQILEQRTKQKFPTDWNSDSIDMALKGTFDVENFLDLSNIGD
jgi:hypothetical protein